MAGIYIHIPFCKQACHYCDFHFSTNLDNKAQLIDAIVKELSSRTGYLNNEIIDTIYFGGGTPSIATEKELGNILNEIYTRFNVNTNAEVTLEGNPDDLDQTKLYALQKLGFNRLSIGIQSFNEAHLKYLNRAHNSIEAESCVKTAQDAGFNNISIDLIYGIPAPNHEIWENDLKKATQLQVQHISAYCLTIEEKTAFGNWLKKGKIPPIEEEFSAQQFEMLLQHLQPAGFEQYEISNFALPSYYSKHNSNYWHNKLYLGVGPGAHSFDGNSRQYNISNNAAYTKGIGSDKPSFEKEKLSNTDKLNEYIMVRLRTKWGINLGEIKAFFNTDLLQEKPVINSLLQEGLLVMNNNIVSLAPQGKLLADKITLDLFFE